MGLFENLNEDRPILSAAKMYSQLPTLHCFYRSCAVIFGYRRVSRHGRKNQRIYRVEFQYLNGG